MISLEKVYEKLGYSPIAVYGAIYKEYNTVTGQIVPRDTIVPKEEALAILQYKLKKATIGRCVIGMGQIFPKAIRKAIKNIDSYKAEPENQTRESTIDRVNRKIEHKITMKEDIISAYTSHNLFMERLKSVLIEEDLYYIQTSTNLMNQLYDVKYIKNLKKEVEELKGVLNV